MKQKIILIFVGIFILLDMINAPQKIIDSIGNRFAFFIVGTLTSIVLANLSELKFPQLNIILYNVNIPGTPIKFSLTIMTFIVWISTKSIFS